MDLSKSFSHRLIPYFFDHLLPLEKGFYNQSIMIGLCHKPLRFTNDRIAYCSINGNIKGNGRVSLKHLVDNPRFETISGADSAARVLNQLEYGRIDFTLEYPTILKYLTITEARSKLQCYYTTELGDTPVAGAVGCTNNSFSQHFSCCDRHPKLALAATLKHVSIQLAST